MRSRWTRSRLASSSTVNGIWPVARGPGTSLPMFGVMLMSGAPVRDARIQLRIDQIQDQGRQSDRHHDNEDRALNQEPVGLSDRREQDRADPRVAKNHFDQDDASD